MTTSLPIGDTSPGRPGTERPGTAAGSARELWRQHLAGATAAVELPLDRLRPPEREYTPARVAVPVAPRTLAALADLDVTPPVGWLAALVALLVRYGAETDLVVGMPAGDAEATARRVRVPVGASYRALIRQVESAEANANRLPPLPLAEVGRLVRPDDVPGAAAPFPVGFHPAAAGGPVPVWPGADLTLALGPDGAPSLHYDATLFTAATAGRLADHLATLLGSLVAAPDRPVSRATLLPAAERRRMLVDWNDTRVDFTDERPWADRVADLAARRPDAPAVRDRGVRLSFAQLDAAANRLARHLRAGGLPDGGRVGLYLERGTAAVVATLAVHRAAAAVVLLDPGQPGSRTELMLAETRPDVVVTLDGLLDDLPGQVARRAVCLDRDAADIDAREATAPEVAAPGPDAVCQIAYTSGSTGAPKAVRQRHRTLVNLANWTCRAYGVGPEDRASWVSAPGFGIGLLEWMPFLACGAEITIADARTTASPTRLRDWLVARGVTHALVLNRLAERLAGLFWPDRSALRFLVAVGEPLRHWPSPALPFEVVACYGATEVGAATSCYDRGSGVRCTSRGVAEDERAVRLPSAGRPIANMRLYVLDRHREPVPAGVAGELHVAGAGLAAGYLARPECDAEAFVRNPLPEEPEPVLYRTGDLARYRPDGTVEILGRADAVVRVAGRRVTLTEVEAALTADGTVREAAVLARPGRDGRPRLVAYVVPADEAAFSTRELREGLANRLPSHLLPGAIVRLAGLPCLPNGKLDRAALPAPPAPVSDAPYVAPRSELERDLADLCAEVLGVERIGVEDDLTGAATPQRLRQAVSALAASRYGVDLAPDRVASVARAAALIEAARVDQPTDGGDDDGDEGYDGDDEPFGDLPPMAHHPDDRYEPFPLTDTQQAYWIGRSDAVELGSVGCHGYWEWCSGDLDVDRFRAAWARVLQRHDMLRAVIRPDGTQRVLADPPAYEIPVLDLRDRDPADADRAVAELRDHLSHHVAPADTFPLWDVRLTLLPDGRGLIHLGLDLLIIDAWSYFQILVPDLVTCYEDPAAELPEPGLSFRDYVLAAEVALERSEAYQRSKRYWLDRIERGLPAAPELPRAAGAAEVTDVRFTRREHRLDPAAWATLKERAHAVGATPSGVVVAAFAEVLRAWSDNDQFTINFPLFNRLPLHPDVDKLIGDFTTTSLLAVEKVDGTFADRARSLQQQLFEDLEHRHFGGVRVMRELARRQRGQVRAAFPVVVTSLLGQPPRHFTTALGEASHTSTQTPQVTLDFQVSEVAGALHFSWDTIDEVFPAGMLADMFGAYCGLLDRLVAEPRSWRSERFALVPEHQLAVRREVNNTDAPVPDTLLHAPVAAHAAARPDAPAVICGDTVLTYRELDRRVNQVGRLLRDGGARPNELVAVVMEKGWEQIVAAHGVLAAGAAYLPIDAQVPTERLHHLLRDGEVSTVLTQAAVDPGVEWPDGVRRLRVDADFDDVDPAPLAPVQTVTDLAYVIYTSGSTGKPKGVMVDHRGAANTICDVNRRFGVGPDDRCLAVSGLHFDLSVYDVFGIVAAGGTVVVPTPTPNPDPQQWAELVRRHGVTFWNSVPALLEILVSHVEGTGETLAPLALTVLAGDWIPLTLPDRVRAVAPGIRVIGSGGPTETCVWSVINPIGEVDPAWPSIPYGRPMSNQRYHVLDARGDHRPVWVPGEIHIASEVGLARGYWRDPERTDAQFVRDPATGERRYASGDLGRYLPDGSIEILGRTDFQVKIQGHRIELGEVEAALAEHPAVDRAVAVAAGATPQTLRLVAYVTPAQPDAPPEPADVLAHVGAKLPRYLVPGALTVLERLPLTGNGKVDRRALTEATVGRDDEQDFTAPEGPVEQLLAEVWAELLGVDRVGRHDHFFALGGNSVIATQLVSRIRELTGGELPLRAVFTGPTVAEVAATLLDDPEQGEGVAAAARLLAELGEADDLTEFLE
ncbi:amino acid adenylation domain-containing protein [Micromonospora haikouensis]|uniref:amino acid adenylation domain-containing protein n=1 Tax=Micromonospora haikouensis TaxID=686309 RepID=UPI0033D77C3B